MGQMSQITQRIEKAPPLQRRQHGYIAKRQVPGRASARDEIGECRNRRFGEWLCERLVALGEGTAAQAAPVGDAPAFQVNVAQGHFALPDARRLVVAQEERSLDEIALRADRRRNHRNLVVFPRLFALRRDSLKAELLTRIRAAETPDGLVHDHAEKLQFVDDRVDAHARLLTMFLILEYRLERHVGVSLDLLGGHPATQILPIPFVEPESGRLAISITRDHPVIDPVVPSLLARHRAASALLDAESLREELRLPAVADVVFAILRWFGNPLAVIRFDPHPDEWRSLAKVGRCHVTSCSKLLRNCQTIPCENRHFPTFRNTTPVPLGCGFESHRAQAFKSDAVNGLGKIAVVGSGAVGGYYGGMLAQAGCDVHFLMRAELAEVRANGLTIRTRGKDVHLQNVNAFATTAAIGPCDLVIIALKATSNAALDELIPPLLHERTTLLTLQNGLGNEGYLAQRWGAERVMGGLCFVCLNRMAPGVIEHFDHGTISIGEFVGGPQPRTMAVTEAFGQAGIEAHSVEKLITERWRKLLWNIPFNGLAIVAGGATVADVLADDGLRASARALMGEALDAARRLGHEIPDTFADFQIERSSSMGAYRPSSLIDWELGRAVEVEAIWGEPLRQGRAAGAAMPRLELLYRLLRHLGRAR
ncbi:MAG: 2-dehydropantoate 2-reductase [Chthoniobacteraceae bacterium]